MASGDRVDNRRQDPTTATLNCSTSCSTFGVDMAKILDSRFFEEPEVCNLKKLPVS